MKFNWEIYRELNKDLEKVGIKTKRDFERHFVLYGRRENRLYSVYQINPKFNVSNYVKYNKELVGLGVDKIELHWFRNNYKKVEPVTSESVENKKVETVSTGSIENNKVETVSTEKVENNKVETVSTEKVENNKVETVSTEKVENNKVETVSTESKKVVTNKFDLINGIDMIYWINLDRSVDRRVIMNQILERIKVPNKRVSASDGKLMSNIQSNFIFSLPSREESKGVYGCLLSHLRVIKEFWESQNSLALILEDDISLDFMKYWNKDLSTIINEAPKDWEIIMINYTDTSINNHTNLYNKWNQTIFSTMAYIINKKGASKIMNMYKNNKWYINSFYRVADVVIYDTCNTYVYKYPYFTINSNMLSLIHNNHLELHNDSKRFGENMWLSSL